MAPNIHAAQQENPSDTIVIDVINPYNNATLGSTLALSPWNTATWPIVDTNPAFQTRDDYSSAATWNGYPTVPLVDLSDMTTAVADCWDYPSSGAMNWSACFNDHL